MPDARSAINDPARLRAVRELELLNSSVHEPLDRITRLAASSVDAPVASVSVLDDEREHFVTTHGVPAEVGLRHCPVDRSICQFTIASGEPLRIGDMRSDPRFPGSIKLGGLEIVAYLGVPLRLRGGTIAGSLCVIDSRPREWTDVHVAVLAELADEIAGFLALRTEVLRRVMHDPATGVPAETLFLARCDATRNRPSGGRSAMLCIQVPTPARTRAAAPESRVREFVGPDAALRETARRLAETLGSTDILGRLSDDMFAVFAHELADERAALRLAGRLRAALRPDPAPDPGSRSAVPADATRIGIALRDSPQEPAAELVRRAEHVMRRPAAHHAPARLAARAS